MDFVGRFSLNVIYSFTFSKGRGRKIIWKGSVGVYTFPNFL